jgi:protein gp37
MGDNSNIEWTDASWQVTHGCAVVSPGCTNCYAMKMAARLEAMGQHAAAAVEAAATHLRQLDERPVP